MMNSKLRLIIVLLIAFTRVYAQNDASTRTLSGHEASVNSVVYSPDGQFILSGSTDKKLKVWNALTGECLKTFSGHENSIFSIAVSADGKYAVSSSMDKTIKIWNIATGTCVKTLTGHNGYVYSVAFSKDGNYILSGSWDKTIKLWNTSSGACITTFEGHSGKVNSVAFSPDGQFVFSASEDKCLKMWSISSGSCIQTFEGHTAIVSALCVSANGLYLVSSSFDKTVKLWAVKTGKCIKTYAGCAENIKSVTISPNGKFIVSVAVNGVMNIWNVTTGISLMTIPGHNGDINSVAFSAAGKFFATGCTDKTIKIWDTTDVLRPDIAEMIKSYVEEKINIWQQKSEFEKTTDYDARVNSKTREKKIQELANEKLLVLKKEFAATIDWKTFELSTYDADNETYLVKNKTRNYAIKVPFADAKDFKANWSKMNFGRADFFVDNGHFELATFTIYLPTQGSSENTKKWVYDSQQPTDYNPPVASYKFSPVDVNLEKGKSTTGTSSNNGKKAAKNVLRADVDVAVPEYKDENPNTFALIIANENYQNEPAVSFANNDGEAFQKYCLKTLGVPKENIRFLPDATLGNMLLGLKWIQNFIKIKEGEAKVIFYYAGHGVPDESTKQAFLLPVDGNGGETTSCINLDEIYTELSKFPTKQVMVFLDACFSGGTRSDEMLAKGARAVKLKSKTSAPPANMIVLSAASGDETAYPYTEKQHGLFTYFLLKKIQSSKGSCTIKDLADYVKKSVGEKALYLNNGKPQTPTIFTGSGIQDGWENLGLR